MIPENVKKLCESLPVTDGSLQIKTRIRRVDDRPPNAALKHTEISDSMLDDWNCFHQQISYPNFASFFDKEQFAQNILDMDITLDAFLSFIADRAYLFLAYSVNLSDPDYPDFADTYTQPRNNGLRRIKYSGFSSRASL